MPFDQIKTAYENKRPLRIELPSYEPSSLQDNPNRLLILEDMDRLYVKLKKLFSPSLELSTKRALLELKLNPIIMFFLIFASIKALNFWCGAVFFIIVLLAIVTGIAARIFLKNPKHVHHFKKVPASFWYLGLAMMLNVLVYFPYSSGEFVVPGEIVVLWCFFLGWDTKRLVKAQQEEVGMS